MTAATVANESANENRIDDLPLSLPFVLFSLAPLLSIYSYCRNFRAIDSIGGCWSLNISIRRRGIAVAAVSSRRIRSAFAGSRRNEKRISAKEKSNTFRFLLPLFLLALPERAVFPGSNKFNSGSGLIARLARDSDSAGSSRHGWNDTHRRLNELNGGGRMQNSIASKWNADGRRVNKREIADMVVIVAATAAAAAVTAAGRWW